MRKFEAIGDRFLSHLANHANIDSKVVLVKHRKAGYLVVLKVPEDELERVKTSFITELRSFAHQNQVEYLTQHFKVGFFDFLTVMILPDGEGEA